MSESTSPGGDADHPQGEKLQKVLARAGFGSRRELERWISEGRISIDGHKASLGDRVLPTQVIRVDGRVVQAAATAPKRRILLYHKPEGELCTRSDPQGRPTVFDHLPTLRNGRWITVGRLDFNTSGLLLLTSDGELANRLMHPSQEIEREYAVRVFGEASPEVLRQLRAGIQLDDGLAQFNGIADAGGEGSNHWYHVTLSEGRYREVRRLWEAVGLTVSRLTRVRFGTLMLPRGLRAGRWQELDEAGVRQVLQMVGMRPERSVRSVSVKPRSRGAGRPAARPPARRRKVSPRKR